MKIVTRFFLFVVFLSLGCLTTWTMTGQISNTLYENMLGSISQGSYDCEGVRVVENTLRGLVLDTDTYEPIQDAEVTIRSMRREDPCIYYSLQEDVYLVTNSQGVFSLTEPLRISTFERLQIQVSASGCDQYEHKDLLESEFRAHFLDAGPRGLLVLLECED